MEWRRRMRISYRGWGGYKGDPLGNRNDAIILAKNIEAGYHEKGYTGVRCVITHHEFPIKHYAITSNLRFDARSI